VITYNEWRNLDLTVSAGNGPGTNKGKITMARIAVKYKNNADRFVDLGNKRTNSALLAIERLGQLTGKAYDSTKDQRSKIINVLKEKITAVEARFNGAVDTKAFKL
jgi:hypothetical protein